MEENLHYQQLLTARRFEKLELMLGKKIAQQLYDSSDYEEGFPEFYEKIQKPSNIVILIEDIDGNVFGGYVPGSTPLKKYLFLNQNCCLFSINSNRRYSSQSIFPLKEYLNCGFELCQDDEDILCRFGVIDVIINKDRTGSVRQCSFYYDKDNLHPFVKGEVFIVKRLQVFKMVEFDSDLPNIM